MRPPMNLLIYINRFLFVNLYNNFSLSHYTHTHAGTHTHTHTHTHTRTYICVCVSVCV